MFGLMKSCGIGDEQQRVYRQQHYCGTCKAIGQMYGQTARLLTNSDVAFLAELLTAFSDESQKPAQWSSTCYSLHCLDLPQQDGLPIALQYAATANMVLGAVQAADHIADSQAISWRIAQRWFTQPFQRAAVQMEFWGYPMPEIWHWNQQQQEREANVAQFYRTHTPEATLTHLAEPTGQMTGLTFAHGAQLIGRADLSAQLYDLGHTFGQLIYALDAWEDYEEDAKTQHFNILKVTASSPAHGLEWITTLQRRAERLLEQLPLTPKQMEGFVARLGANLEAHLTPATCVSPKMSLTEKWQYAQQTAQTFLRSQRTCAPSHTSLRTSLQLASYTAVAFALPPLTNLPKPLLDDEGAAGGICGTICVLLVCYNMLCGGSGKRYEIREKGPCE